MEATTTRTEQISRYLQTWNETNAERRLQTIAEIWEESGSYTDPLFAVRGVSQIDELIGGFQQQYPGLTFVQTGEPEVHHNLARFTWDLVAPDGEIGAKGTDIALFAENGRIEAIAGFFDQAPVLG
jgi:hypothetical protein